ncbi:MAG: nuclear transport factor 2 family protein [Acidobacteriota bacterium]
MKCASKIVLVMLLLSSIAVPQTKGKRTTKARHNKPSVASIEQTLRDLELQWNEAFKNRDKDVLGRILDDKFIFTDDDGQVSDKTQYIDAVMQAIKVESYKLDDVTVRSYGNTVLLLAAGLASSQSTAKMPVATSGLPTLSCADWVSGELSRRRIPDTTERGCDFGS